MYVVFIIEKYEQTPLDKEDREHILLIISFYNENKKNQMIEHIRMKIEECSNRMKSLLEFNYLGIEENIRKVIEYAIFSDKGKREVYQRVFSNLN